MMPTMSRTGHRMNAVVPGEFSPDKLIDAMRAKGINAQALSEETGTSVEAIARWMAGIANPKPGYLKNAAKALGIPEDDLLD